MNERVRNRIVASVVVPTLVGGALRVMSHSADNCVMEPDLHVGICHDTDVLYPSGEKSEGIIHNQIFLTVHHDMVLALEMFEDEYCNIRVVGDRRFRNYVNSNEEAIRQRMDPNQEPIIFEPTYLGICVRRY